MTWTPCERCNRLGWVTVFHGTSALGSVETCPECRGHKGHDDSPEVILGECKFCHQRIPFPAGDIPCNLGRTAHVISGFSGQEATSK